MLLSEKAGPEPLEDTWQAMFVCAPVLEGSGQQFPFSECWHGHLTLTSRFLLFSDEAKNSKIDLKAHGEGLALAINLSDPKGLALGRPPHVSHQALGA